MSQEQPQTILESKHTYLKKPKTLDCQKWERREFVFLLHMINMRKKRRDLPKMIIHNVSITHLYAPGVLTHFVIHGHDL